MFQNYVQYMFICYKNRKFLIIHITTLNYKQIFQVYMCAVNKMKFVAATSEKKKMRCFQIKYLYFNQYIFISIIYKHTEPDFWWENNHMLSITSILIWVKFFPSR